MLSEWQSVASLRSPWLVPCQSCLYHRGAAYRHQHGFSRVPHSHPTLAALWTKFIIQPKPTPYPIATWHTSLIPLRNYKWVAPTACHSSLHIKPKQHLLFLNVHLGAREEIKRPHINLGYSEPQEGHIYTKLITSTHINRNDRNKLNEVSVSRITTPPAQQYKSDLIVCPLYFLLILPGFHYSLSLKRGGNRSEFFLDGRCFYVIKFQTSLAAVTLWSKTIC